MNFLGQQWLTTFGAYHYGMNIFPHLSCSCSRGTATFVDHMNVTPMHRSHHHGIQIEAFLGQNVFVPFWRLLVGYTPQDALPNQLLQPFCKQMSRNPERGLKCFEPPGYAGSTRAGS